MFLADLETTKTNNNELMQKISSEKSVAKAHTGSAHVEETNTSSKQKHERPLPRFCCFCLFYLFLFCLFICLFIIYLLIYLFIYLFIYLLLFIYLFVYLFTYFILY
jgi:hypothetical protein